MQRQEEEIQQLLSGTQTELPPSLGLYVDGKQLTTAQIAAKLQDWLAIYQRVAEAKAAYGQAVQALQDVADEAHAFKVAYRQVLAHVLGKGSPNLASFGINVVQRRIPSAETQLLAHAKRLATRKARGTLGKRQKQRIKGAVVAAVTVSASAEAPEAVPLLVARETADDG